MHTHTHCIAHRELALVCACGALTRAVVEQVCFEDVQRTEGVPLSDLGAQSRARGSRQDLDSRPIHTILFQLVVHDASEIIWRVEGGVSCHKSKVLAGPAKYILPLNFNEPVPVKAHVLMPEAQNVPQLMQCIACGGTVGLAAEEHGLFPTMSANRFRVTLPANTTSHHG